MSIWTLYQTAYLETIPVFLQTQVQSVWVMNRPSDVGVSDYEREGEIVCVCVCVRVRACVK
jgi:hypothetical protein